MSHVPFPLFHGTSTLFLDSIIHSGLGGIDPVREWKILEFARVIYPFVQQHISKEPEFKGRAQSFGFMVEQKTEAMNFQHGGEVYLSPASSTAIRYAVNNRAGSELLSNILDFLEELLRRNVPGVANDLFHRYPQIFNLLDISAAPLLIEASSVSTPDLLTEHGEEAESTLDYVTKTLKEEGGCADIVLQQSNFRLCRPVPISGLKIWLINVTQYNVFQSRYTLYELPAKEVRLGGS